LRNCNGWIAAYAQNNAAPTQIADCTAAGASAAAGQDAWNKSQQLAWAIGQANGLARPDYNFADTAFTAGNPGAGLVEFQTATNIPFTAANRFISFSADVAAINCNVAVPLLQFQLLNDAGTATNAGSQVNGCANGRAISVPAIGPTAPAGTVNVTNATSNGAVLFSGSSVGIRMVNNQGSGTGNDHTIDNIRILDVTPQLDKSFSPATVPTGGVSKLTFTVTNTNELGAKNGWSFTDKLPAGLTIANPNAAATTCGAGQVTAAAGSNSVAVTGNLNAGQASCTVTVNVTSPTAGSFTNGPDNVTETGLNPPGDTTVTFVNPDIPTVLCTTDPAIFNTGFNSTTGGQAANGAFDARWTVAGGASGLSSPAGTAAIQLPPAGTTYAPAEVGKVSSAWADSPAGNAQWISADYTTLNGQNQTTGTSSTSTPRSTRRASR
jgi:hypothetical protein